MPTTPKRNSEYQKNRYLYVEIPFSSIRSRENSSVAKCAKFVPQRLEEHQAAATALRLQLNISSEALEQSRLDVDLLLRVKRGTVGELPDAVAPLHEPFDFSDSCLVSQEAVDAYKRDIISGGRQKLKLLEAMKVRHQPNAYSLVDGTKRLHMWIFVKSTHQSRWMHIGTGTPSASRVSAMANKATGTRGNRCV